MLTVITLLKLKPSPNGEQHGERPFWREFGEQYLHAWLRGVYSHVPAPFRVVVMTDSASRLPPNENDATTTYVALDSIVDAPGFWSKLNMFRPEVSQGKCLYLDLDNVINGPLDELCALEPDPLIMLDDRRVPGLPNGSAILFDADECRIIWDRYVKRKAAIELAYVPRIVNGVEDYLWAYDQAYIAGFASGDVPLFFQSVLPDGYILNARSELPNASDWKSARLIFGGGAEGKPHLSKHPGFSLRA